MMPQFQIISQAPLIAFISVFIMLGGILLLLFGLGIIQSGTGQDIIFKINSGRRTSLIGSIGIVLGGIGIFLSISMPEPRLITPTMVVEESISTESRPQPDSAKLPVTPTGTLMPELPSDTPTPIPTNTPKPTNIPMPTATIDADPTVYDNFNNTVFDGKWHEGLWRYASDSGDTLVTQQEGILKISRQSSGGGGLTAYKVYRIDEAKFVEAKLKLDENFQASLGDVGVGLLGDHDWWLKCSIYSWQGNSTAEVHCSGEKDYTSDAVGVQYNSWYTIRLEINPDLSTISFFLDDKQFDSYTLPNSDIIKQFGVELSVWSANGGIVTGYIDNVKVGK
jgi:hypothetical protein